MGLKRGVSKTFERRPANGGDTVHWQTNDASFRGRELRSNPGTRVIVYGDSNIQARFSHLDQSFPQRLERHLQASSGGDVEVINAGVVGFGPDQCLIRLSSDIDEHDPDVVVFHVFADNDFGDVVRNRLFELDANGALVRTNQRATLDQTLESSRLLITRAARKIARLGRSEPAYVHGASVDEVIEMLVERGAFPMSRSRAHTHRRHGHPLQTVPSAGLIERPPEKNRVDALR